MGFEFPEANSWLGAVAVHAQDQRVPAREIYGNVFVRLKISKLAHLFGTDAAGGEVRHGTVREFNSSVRDVHFVGKHRQPDGADLDRRCAGHPKHQVEVVNHEVEDHIHIQAAGAEDP